MKHIAMRTASSALLAIILLTLSASPIGMAAPGAESAPGVPGIGASGGLASSPGQAPGGEVPQAVYNNTFTYQGSLKSGGVPANGVYDFQFKLFDASSTLLDTVQVDATVTDGLFSADLYFDAANAFDGNERWLQIEVRSSSLDPYTVLSPRQKINANPYSLYTLNAGKLEGQAGSYYRSATNINAGTLGNGYFSAYSDLSAEGYLGNAANDIALNNGTLQTSLNADNLDGKAAADFLWLTGGTMTGNLIVDPSAKLGVNTASPRTFFEAVAGGMHLLSFKGNGAITMGSLTGNLYEFAGADYTGPSGQLQGGYGLASGNNLVSPVVWMYATSGNAFLVKQKGYGSTVQDGSKLLSVNVGGSTDVYGILRVKDFSSPYNTVVEIGKGLDYAEAFAVSGEQSVKPGMVVVIDPQQPGGLMLSTSAYDTRVAGVVAGANGLKSGVSLGSDILGGQPVALAGRVYCYVDASFGAVQPGDLLTTSPNPGYAMKAGDLQKAQGAILGKAMGVLAAGQRGLLLILVTLQ
jgi:hypothetical protein